MKSMTGYGKGIVERDNKTLTVELKAVNNRFLEINVRLPKFLLQGDEIVRKKISSVIRRGTVDFYFDYKDLDGDKALSIDYELAKLYVNASKKLFELGVKDELSTTDLLRLPDVVATSTECDVDTICEMLACATEEAVSHLDEMRCLEGKSVEADFYKLIGNIRAHLDCVIKRAPTVVEEYREKLLRRISDYLKEVEPDEARLINEVAFFADKADINEEISRLQSHIAQFESVLGHGGEAGRKLDFLAQEMNREINTMGSKSNDIELTNHVVAMKNELEKIKEQVRNVE